MTTSIQFGKDKYHLQATMVKWCNDNIGRNSSIAMDWAWGKPKEWEEGSIWKIESAFGNTWFHFRDEKHAVLFALRWV